MLPLEFQHAERHLAAELAMLLANIKSGCQLWRPAEFECFSLAKDQAFQNSKAAMSNTISLIKVAEVAAGCSAEVVAEGRVFAVYNVDGEFSVLDGICPHAGGPLGKGMLNGNVVTCPWHGWQFDVTTGQHCLNNLLCQPGYAVSIVEGMVTIDLPGAD